MLKNVVYQIRTIWLNGYFIIVTAIFINFPLYVAFINNKLHNLDGEVETENLNYL